MPSAPDSRLSVSRRIDRRPSGAHPHQAESRHNPSALKLLLITAEDPLTLQARSRELIRFPQLTMPLLGAQRLDRRLFNVSELIEMGYDDAHADSVPLIATYSTRQRRAGRPPAWATKQVDAEPITRAPVSAAKTPASTAWSK